MAPVRTCVGCRERDARKKLLRVVAIEQESGWVVTPDPLRRTPGRGANLHPTSECLDLALRRRAFPRALRVTDRLASEPVRDYVQQRTTVPPAGGHTGGVPPTRPC
ncbi:MAG TPA: YlxR family protein [Nocardioidaceae bacterium]|nr:YlxR family protein [Nocardioidaceae bacterium]